ncbi:MAG: hypothetical protein ACLP8S_21770 [Solirubrobacteraceae bacterium]
MRIPDSIRDCVCFIGTEDAHGGVHLGGTVGLVSMRLGSLHRYATYFITARHCVRRAIESGDKPVVRVNSAEDGVSLIDISTLTWNYPDNDASDIAVSDLLPDGLYTGTTLRAFDVSLILTRDEAKRVRLGIGDELICTGLFHMRTGDRRNIPIARFGNLAAMPEEPLVDEDSGLEFDAFLAEIRSIGGLSGSPVFTRLPPGRKDADGEIAMSQQWFWLGTIRGHWKQDQFSAADATGGEASMINTGIAMVTPAWEALEVLSDEGYVRDRRESERELRKKDEQGEAPASS